MCSSDLARAEICPRCGVRQPPRHGPSAAPSVIDPEAPSKVAAGLLAILLGGLGVHRFYLGDLGLGLLYALFSWSGVPSVIGLIEGIAEGIAAAMRVVSGAIGDKLGRYKAIVVFGYGLSAVSKIAFPFAGSPIPIFAARIVDRVGKGLRTAPRDAMIARATDPSIHGRAFGLRQTLDTLGAVIGPLLAIVILWASQDNFQLLFWVAFVPGVQIGRAHV